MKFFISYCDDGEGLIYATRAKQLCSIRGIEAWIWKYDSNPIEWLKTDIAKNIDTADAMLTIVTKGTNASDPQKQEWSLADSLNKGNCSIRKVGLIIPLELRGRPCPEFDDSDFEKICTQTIDHVIEYLGTNIPIPKEEPSRRSQLQNMAAKLNKNQSLLNQDTIDEFYNSVLESYDESALIKDIVTLSEASSDSIRDFIDIYIYSSIELAKFNASDYLWDYAFRQLGREIAAAEQKELVSE